MRWLLCFCCGLHKKRVIEEVILLPQLEDRLFNMVNFSMKKNILDFSDIALDYISTILSILFMPFPRFVIKKPPCCFC